MKEIKTKPEGNPKILDTAARVPKSALKALWLKSKERGVSELKETPFASKRQESANEPANTAGDQMLSGMETAAKKGVNLVWRGGKKLAQDTARKIKEKRELSRTAETLRDTGIKAGKIGSDAVGNLPKSVPSARPQAGSVLKTGKSVGEAAKSGVKAVRQSAKTVRSSVKTAEYTVKTALSGPYRGIFPSPLPLGTGPIPSPVRFPFMMGWISRLRRAQPSWPRRTGLWLPPTAPIPGAGATATM